ncbi:CopK family periplasmic copper-binding protein [Hydrogenophaga sp. R2]|uniref:CopK family periplasmic copper-binding protein n=1 Tax=Hydrogenophaga sp. R2 TaxID=3132827 RepID=UPI003CEF6B59
MIRKLSILVLSLVAVVPVFAMDAARSEAREVVALQKGETLYVFKDGRMAKESKFGSVLHLKEGEIVQTVDGRSITTVGNEVARLHLLLLKGHGN